MKCGNAKGGAKRFQEGTNAPSPPKSNPGSALAAVLYLVCQKSIPNTIIKIIDSLIIGFCIGPPCSGVNTTSIEPTHNKMR